MNWIERFTLRIIAHPPGWPLMSFEMTINENEAARMLRDRGYVRRRFGFWFATTAGRKALSE
jgi:hypothetical protein